MKNSVDIALTQLRDRMYRYARSILGSQPEAEDATHDTIERLLNRRTELRLCRNLDSFALTALRNRCIDRLRSRHNEEQLSEALRSESDAVERWSSRELVRTAMARLPLRQREVLHLKEIEGYSTHEIAAMISTEENQVRTILSRGRKALRAEVEKLMQ